MTEPAAAATLAFTVPLPLKFEPESSVTPLGAFIVPRDDDVNIPNLAKPALLSVTVLALILSMPWWLKPLRLAILPRETSFAFTLMVEATSLAMRPETDPPSAVIVNVPDWRTCHWK